MKKKKCFEFFSSILNGQTQANSQTQTLLQKKKEENRNNNNSESWNDVLLFLFTMKKKTGYNTLPGRKQQLMAHTSLTSKYVCKQLKYALKQN